MELKVVLYPNYFWFGFCCHPNYFWLGYFLSVWVWFGYFFIQIIFVLFFLPVSEQQERAFTLGLAGLLGEGVYNFGELVSAATPLHPWSPRSWFSPADTLLPVPCS